MATLQLYLGKGGLIFQLEFSRTMDAKSKSEVCLPSNVKSWFLTSYSPWPMKCVKLMCMYIGEIVHDNIVRKTIFYTPVGACDFTIMNLAKNVHEYRIYLTSIKYLVEIVCYCY